MFLDHNQQNQKKKFIFQQQQKTTTRNNVFHFDLLLAEPAALLAADTIGCALVISSHVINTDGIKCFNVLVKDPTALADFKGVAFWLDN